MTRDRAALPRPSLLIVDDDGDIRESLQMALAGEMPDVDVVVAPDVPTAKGLLDERAFDVVVSDYHIGASDGVSFLADARRLRPQMRCALFTGAPDEGLARRAKREAGIDRFFVKPLDLTGFTHGIRALLPTSA